MPARRDARFDLNPATRTLTDAFAVPEVLSDDAADIDRTGKLADYATLPSARGYVLLDQTAEAATVFRRDPGGPWVAESCTEGSIMPPGPDISPGLAGLYRGLALPARPAGLT